MPDSIELVGISAACKDFLIGFNLENEANTPSVNTPPEHHYRLPWEHNEMQDDMAFFRKCTAGCTVVMGRKTWEGIGHLLPGRLNLVFSHQSSVQLGSQTALHQNQSLSSSERDSLLHQKTAGLLLSGWDELAQLLHAVPANRQGRTTFLIGGAELFESAFSQGFLKEFYLTYVDTQPSSSLPSSETPKPEVPRQSGAKPGASPNERSVYLLPPELIDELKRAMANIEPIYEFPQGPRNLYPAAVYYLKGLSSKP